MPLPSLQILRQLQRRRIPPPRILIQALQTNRFQIAIDGAIDRARLRRIIHDHLPQHIHLRARKRRPARQHADVPLVRISLHALLASVSDRMPAPWPDSGPL